MEFFVFPRLSLKTKYFAVASSHQMGNDIRNSFIRAWNYSTVQTRGPGWLAGERGAIKSTPYGRLTDQRPECDGSPIKCPHKPPAPQFYSEHLSTSKLARHRVSKIHISRLRMAAAERRTPLASYTLLGPLPLPEAESEDRVAIWRDHTERCGNLKARSYCASYQESLKASIKTRSICWSGLSKCCPASSPGKLKGHRCTFSEGNLAPINIMSPGY